jgi:tetratricopeptide (TPR) repeat protein
MANTFPNRQIQEARSTAFLCAGAILILALMNLGIEASHAGHDLTLPESLLTQGKLPPERADGPFQYWSQRKKYFLVIAVNQTDVPKTELPFAQVDGQRVMNALTGLGYQPVDPAHPMLTGKAATASAIMASLDEARKKEEDATFIIYYTGHGAVGPKDLWLQTAGQVKVGDGQGVKVSDLIVQIRQTATGKAFEGEVVLILDACYSGQGTVSQGLTLGELGKRTTILTSSTDIQESFSLNPPVVPKQMSAFTHTFLQALGPDWGQADGDHDGLLRWEELKLYTIKQLRQFKEQGALGQSMTPEMVSNYSEGLLSYRRDQVRIWRSGYRDVLTTQAMEKILAAHLQNLEASLKDKPSLPKEVQLLAQNLEPAGEDYYTQAVKATAEGQLENARALFAKAEAQSQERATQAAVVKQRETEQQGQIYLSRARMEMYAGRFTEAFRQYQRAAKLFPLATPELLNEMGGAGLRAGQYPEAEPYLTEALKQREQTLAPNNAYVAMSLSNLAGLYHAQGQYGKAEPLCQRALTIWEKALGPDHPNTAMSLNNLALLYFSQGQYDKAEPLYQRSLTIREKALGPDHPDTATGLNNLAQLYLAQGQYGKAEPLYQRSLTIFEAALGPNHPDVAISLSNLALLYQAQEKYAEAKPLYQRSFWIRHNTLGPDHPTVRNIFATYQAFLNASGQPHDENDAWEQLRSSRYAPTSKTTFP